MLSSLRRRNVTLVTYNYMQILIIAVADCIARMMTKIEFFLHKCVLFKAMTPLIQHDLNSIHIPILCYNLKAWVKMSLDCQVSSLFDVRD